MMGENQIVRRLRAFDKETGPESVRGLRDDAASEIVLLRVLVIVLGVTPWLLWLFGVVGRC